MINTGVNFEVFEEGELPVDESLLDNITEVERRHARALMSSGYYQDGLFVNKFLREDLTINLEKLEFAVALIVTFLESSHQDDVTLKLKGLREYYDARGVSGLPKREREERTFLLGFISAVAAEASKRDTLEVKYVE